MTKTIAFFFASLSMPALGGCAVDGGSSSSSSSSAEAPDNTATSTQALADVGPSGPTTGHCKDGFCTCTGDDDCNGMYSGNECANDGICQINESGVPRCRCKAAAARVHAGLPLTTVKASGALSALAP